VLAHDGAIQDNRADAYKRVILDRAAVNYRRMTDRYAISYYSWELIVSNVHNSPILDVRVSADSYLVDIRSNNAIEPDARLLAQMHIADNLSTRLYESRRSYPGPQSFVFFDHKIILCTLPDIIFSDNPSAVGVSSPSPIVKIDFPGSMDLDRSRPVAVRKDLTLSCAIRRRKAAEVVSMFGGKHKSRNAGGIDICNVPLIQT
jgi:hypothetical protein